ncbi:MAG TPA: hypothetical protein DEA96_02775 [Leptospiraceae bacterium]|nr:hypothetical protein [Spirochaetaceae bacterium]HBS03861.1 hypothetical protein [Leptospiraceae bacterium]
MLFNTLDFVAFLVGAFALFLAFPRWRKQVVLGASLLFYGSYNWAILALLLLTVAGNYFGAKKIDTDSGKGRKLILIACVSLNMAFLGFFKYTNMLLYWTGMAIIREPLEAPFDILLPVGISFYTFQVTSYVVDVYRGLISPEKSYSKLVLFTVYFPQLVAGPIERAGRLLPELEFRSRIPRDMVWNGLMLCLWGYFKKVYVADNLSPLVDYILVLDDPPAGAMLFAALLFPLQLYADFTGYTDIARGLSRMMGIELSLNFFHPFLATNHIEFWRRWHITLGAFLRDYLYIPLGGSRVGPARSILNIMIVWALGGLWHGATAGYFVWGLYCGVLVAITGALLPGVQRWSGDNKARLTFLASIGRVFTFLTFSLGLLILRAPDASRLVEMLMALADFRSTPMNLDYVWLSLIFLVPLILFEFWRIISRKEEPWTQSILAYPSIFFWLFMIWAAGRFEAKEFFYFQF